MKLIIAQIPNDTFEATRTELLAQGVLRMSVAQIYTADPQSTKALHYRGLAVKTHLRPQLRVECIVAAQQSCEIVDILRGSAALGHSGSVAVLDLEEYYPASSEAELFTDDPRLVAATR